MKKLTIKKFELEFLKQNGVDFINKKFVDRVTGKTLTLSSCKETFDAYRNVSTLEYRYEFQNYEIEFYRSGDSFRVSINRSGLKHYATERYLPDDDLIQERVIGIVSEGKDEAVKKDFGLANTLYRNDPFSCIRVFHEDSSIYYSRVTFSDNNNQSVPIMACSLSKIYTYPLIIYGRYSSSHYLGSYDKSREINFHAYCEELIHLINDYFTYDAEKNFYYDNVEFLARAFESHLKMPFLYKEKFANCLKEIKYRDRGLEREGSSVDEMTQYLNEFYPCQDINMEKGTRKLRERIVRKK